MYITRLLSIMLLACETVVDAGSHQNHRYGKNVLSTQDRGEFNVTD